MALLRKRFPCRSSSRMSTWWSSTNRPEWWSIQPKVTGMERSPQPSPPSLSIPQRRGRAYSSRNRASTRSRDKRRYRDRQDNEVHFKLAAQFESREVRKEYRAIVVGSLDRDRDWIRQPIGNHPYQRDKMSIRADTNRVAMRKPSLKSSNAFTDTFRSVSNRRPVARIRSESTWRISGRPYCATGCMLVMLVHARPIVAQASSRSTTPAGRRRSGSRSPGSSCLSSRVHASYQQPTA